MDFPGIFDAFSSPKASQANTMRSVEALGPPIKFRMTHALQGPLKPTVFKSIIVFRIILEINTFAERRNTTDPTLP